MPNTFQKFKYVVQISTQAIYDEPQRFLSALAPPVLALVVVELLKSAFLDGPTKYLTVPIEIGLLTLIAVRTHRLLLLDKRSATPPHISDLDRQQSPVGTYAARH